MLILYLTKLLFFLISCDCGSDWIIIFIYLVLESKHGETGAKISSNLWFDIWMFKVSSVKYQWTFYPKEISKKIM